MKLGFDARMVTWGGIGTYSLELLRVLGCRRGEFGLDLVVVHHPQDDWLTRLPELQDVTWRSAASDPWTPLGSLEAGRAVRGEVDLYHAPHVTVPLVQGARLVTTVHDLIPLQRPETMPNPLRRAAFLLAVREAVRRSDLIVAVSRHAAEGLYDRRLRPRQLEVIPHGVDPRFLPVESWEVAELRERYNLEKFYLLWVGAFRPHKNVETLIRAYAHLKPSMRESYDLVLAGDPNSPGAFRARRLASELLGDEAERVRFPGHIETDDLPGLYTGATLFVFPSLAEGFGLPPLEAMACGTPVLASGRPPMPEVLCGGAEYFNPRSPAELAAKLSALLERPRRMEELGKRGRQRSRLFSWDKTAERTVEVYRRALG